MRLSKREIEAILQVAEDIYGTDVKGILDRVRMASRIKSLIGDQKIDIIGDYEDNQVVQEVLKNGILLAI